MYRPAKLGRDPKYVWDDPGCRYIDGVTETWIGPLAEDFEIEGMQAYSAQRMNLFDRRSPDGSTVLLPHIKQEHYRPVIGGNFFLPKSLSAWMAEQTEAIRFEAEAEMARAALVVVKESMLPDLKVRTGHAGLGEGEPARGMATLWLHGVNSLSHYTPHVMVEIHTLGKVMSDGRFRAVSSESNFANQREYGLIFANELIARFEAKFQISLVQGPNGLEVKGLEAMRDIKTARQEQIEKDLKEKGLPKTVKTVHYSSRKTHTKDGGKKTTMAEAVRRTRDYWRAKGVDATKTVRSVTERVSVYLQERRVERAVRATVKAIERAGEAVRPSYFEMLVRYQLKPGTRNDIVDRVLHRASADPGSVGLLQLKNGKLTTPKVELSRLRWGQNFVALGRVNHRGPSERAAASARLENRSSLNDRVVRRAGRILPRKGTHTGQLGAEIKLVIDAYRAEKRRVFVVAGPKSTTTKFAGVRTMETTAFTRRLGKAGLWDTFLEIRRHRWRSARHFAEIYTRARAPKLKLSKKDLIVLDARQVSQHAIRDIMAAARKAKAAVILISPEPVVRHPSQLQARRHEQGPERER